MKRLLYVLFLFSILFNTANANNSENHTNNIDCHSSMMMEESIEQNMEEECCECENCNNCLLNISIIINNITQNRIKQSEKYLYNFSDKINKQYLLYRPPKLS